MSSNSRSGYVVLIGQPNVGKSTLLNHLLGKKLSITSRKPQTTRHRILGVKTIDDVQILYVDTPGMHIKEKSQMNRYMNRVARAALADVNVTVFVVTALHWDDEDEMVLRFLKKLDKPIIVALNKIDQVKDRAQLLPFMETLAEKHPFQKIIPVSATREEQLDVLEQEIIAGLPQDVHYYSPEQFTDRSDRFIAAEIVREKLMRFLGQEIPYALTVTIDAFEPSEKITKIAATIWVEKDGQKAIVIGKNGTLLKKIGTKARIDMEAYFDQKVFLQLWVKVRSNWSDDAKALEGFGYSE